MLFSVLIGAGYGGEGRYLFPIFLIALDGSVAEAQREGRVWRLGKPSLRKARSSDVRAVPPDHGIDFVVEALAGLACLGVDGAHQDDQRIRAGVHGRLPALIVLFWNR